VLSGLLCLHARVWEMTLVGTSPVLYHKDAETAIKSACRIVIDVSRRFRMDLREIDLAITSEKERRGSGTSVASRPLLIPQSLIG